MKKYQEMRLRCSDKQESGPGCPVSLGTSINQVYAGKPWSCLTSAWWLVWVFLYSAWKEQYLLEAQKIVWGLWVLQAHLLQNSWNWWWFRPCARMKFTVFMTVVTLSFIPSTFPHKVSWWIMQWYIIRGVWQLLSFCIFSFISPTKPLFLHTLQVYCL